MELGGGCLLYYPEWQLRREAELARELTKYKWGGHKRSATATRPSSPYLGFRAFTSFTLLIFQHHSYHHPDKLSVRNNSRDVEDCKESGVMWVENMYVLLVVEMFIDWLNTIPTTMQSRAETFLVIGDHIQPCSSSVPKFLTYSVLPSFIPRDKSTLRTYW